jgi:hypothetical protein
MLSEKTECVEYCSILGKYIHYQHIYEAICLGKAYIYTK